ncbi:dipeptidase [Parapusillimonas granuli]|uniref:Membrane dipeptidase n=1 Tax=Parapusillimonas granuli TaxID=380911 RepID=A0A853G4V7_9BURK|nr:membrane dipeptidase [Parapusillimonas granuli]MBB5215582.1 membrane dipeptidase [Parapusillimonas granuli]NYT49751.1 membrane dipeptidase [Parapusillimonas granuli]
MNMQTSQQLLIVDGLVYFCDGNPIPLLEGGVTAANITVTHMHWDLGKTITELGRWHKRLSAPDSKWRLVKTAGDIERAKQEGRAGLIMGWQNSLPFDGEVDRAAAFHALGMRVIQLTYNEANLAGDGCIEERNGGLTRFGRALVAELNDVGIAIDLSHCGERTSLDAASLSSKPVLATHANAKAVDDQVRNKSDEVLRAIAATGGVIGASIHGFMNWDGNPKNPPTLANFVRHVQHIADVVGVEHIGIGTDFSAVQDEQNVRSILELSKGAYPETGGKYAQAFGNASASRYPSETPTPSRFGHIIEALEKGGFSAEEIQGIAGGNFIRAFERIWG